MSFLQYCMMPGKHFLSGRFLLGSSFFRFLPNLTFQTKNMHVSHDSVCTIYYKTYFKSLELILLWPFESCVVHILIHDIVHCVQYLVFSNTVTGLYLHWEF